MANPDFSNYRMVPTMVRGKERVNIEECIDGTWRFVCSANSINGAKSLIRLSAAIKNGKK